MTEAPRLSHWLDGPEDAPALVLGPDLGTTAQIWQDQLPSLAKHWQVVRYDLPGHGGSSVAPAHSVEEIAVLLLKLLDSLGIERFGYAGVGLGGSVGALLALSHPHRLASLVLVGGCAGPGASDQWRQHAVVVRATGLERQARMAAKRWFTARSLEQEPGLAEPCAQMVRGVDPDCYAACCDALADHDLRGQLAGIGAPTMVISGAEDTVAPPGAARELNAGIPDSKLAVVPNAAHLVNIEQPGPVTELLMRHFAATWRERPVAGPGPGRPRPAVAEDAAEDPPPDTAVAAVPDRFLDGQRLRREVLGDAGANHGGAATDPFMADFRELATRHEWGEVWSRPGLDRRVRSCIAITALAVGGHSDDLAVHVRAGLRSGLTPDEIKEVLLQTAVYGGIPAASAAFAVARRVIVEESGTEDESTKE